MATTIVHLVRHGEVHNPEGVVYGRLPGFGLTDRGHAMARTVADAFAEQKRDITAVIASPLLRAQQTAAPIAHAFGLDVEADARLTEASSVFEGVNVNANRWDLLKPSNLRYLLRPMQPSWGEPYDLVMTRMTSAVSSALKGARGHEAVLVSHQMPIVTLTRFAQGKPLPHLLTQRQCSLASVTSLIFSDNTLTGITYDEPARALLAEAEDMNPGLSAAQLKR